MSLLTKLVFVSVAGLAVFVGMKLNTLYEIPPLPHLENSWWGPGKPFKEDISIREFRINVSEEIIIDLKRRLNQTRPFTPPLEGVQQEYGMNTNLLKEIVEFWKTKYNWREREQFLNKYPQFITSIQGLQIHFIHVKPSTTTALKVVPLMLLHGWPGSVREFYEIIPLLTTPQKGLDFVFEVIIPSLPGYGFSQGASKPGLSISQIAVIFKNLMKRLGFDKYYLQGGDWGSRIVADMATFYPEQVLGVHFNLCMIRTPLANLKLLLGSLYFGLVVEKEFEDRMYLLSEKLSYMVLESGYLHLQATKPDTVGVALKDSPVGLAAYIVEKFTTWTNPNWKGKADGGLNLKYSYTDLLDNVMIYWVTESITTSVRLYAESFNKAQSSLGLDTIPVKVPSACARYANELVYQSNFILKEKYKQLVQTTDVGDVGHFAAFEEPKILANDIWSAVQKFHEINEKLK